MCAPNFYPVLDSLSKQSPPFCFSHTSAVGSQSPLHIHLNIGLLLFHLCLCALLRPHSIKGLAHALPPTPLTFAAYIVGQLPKSPFLRASASESSTSILLSIKLFFFPSYSFFFLYFLIAQREESQVQGSFKYDLHI